MVTINDKKWNQRFSFRSAIRFEQMGGNWLASPSVLPRISINTVVKQQLQSVPVDEQYPPIFFTPCAWFRVFKYWRSNWASINVEKFVEADMSDHVAEAHVEECDLSELPITQNQASVSAGCLEFKCEPIEVRQHRRIRRNDRIPYAKLVLDEVRCKFGVPTKSDANRLAVRRFASNIMKNHGVRPSHIVSILPYIVETAFIPSNEDIMAADWGRSSAAKARIKAYLGGATPSVGG